MDCKGRAEGLGQGKEEDWPVRADDRGEMTEHCLDQQEAGNRKDSFQGQCTGNEDSSG